MRRRILVVVRAPAVSGLGIGHARRESPLGVARRPVGAGERPEVLIERPVLLDHHDHVIDVVDSFRWVDGGVRGRRARARSPGGGCRRRSCGRSGALRACGGERDDTRQGDGTEEPSPHPPLHVADPPGGPRRSGTVGGSAAGSGPASSRTPARDHRAAGRSHGPSGVSRASRPRAGPAAGRRGTGPRSA